MTTETEDVTFTISATGPGSDRYTYQWKKKMGNSLFNVTEEQSTPDLPMLAVNPGNSGLYFCIVKNQWNITKKSNMAFLKVVCKSNKYTCIQLP